MISSALAASLLLMNFFNLPHRSPVNNIRPQSEESKKFYLDRAAAKRARRAERNKRNHLLMTLGNRSSIIVRQNAEQADVADAISHADVAAAISHAETELVAATGFDLTTKTVTELRDVAKARGIKVTTKMTKVDLIRALSVEV